MYDHDITICFSTTRKLMSGLIRWATGGKFLQPVTPSHALIAHYDRSLDRRMVMQAETWGFEHRPWERWKQQNILIAEFKPIGPDLEDSLKWISSWLGADYDYWAAFLVGLSRFCKRSIRGKFSNPSKLMCSEAAIRMLNHGGYKAIRGINPEITSPLELMTLLLANNQEFKLSYIRPKTQLKYGV